MTMTDHTTTIATHHGSFHADDVFGVGVLMGVFPSHTLVRTRDPAQIDAADYVVWSKFRNATGINQPADGDRNLVVNDLDYDYWRSRFGQTSGSGASAFVGVPEPATSALLVIVFAALLQRGRLRYSRIR